MKSSVLSIVLACASVPVFGQTIDESSRFIELGIGAGASEGSGDTKGMFTQRLAAEWIVKDNFLSPQLALGVGFQIDNAVGGRYATVVDGKYDYRYTTTVVKHKKDNGHGRPVTTTETRSTRRNGAGLALADVTRDNIDFMPTVSLHGKFIDRFDLYATFGLGLGIMTNSLGNFEPTEIYVPGVGNVGDMEKKTYYDKSTMANGDVWETRYSYNDADHAEWNKKPYKAKAVFACAFYLGARYFINDSWGVNAQFGLVSADVSKKYGNSYNILSVGATYRF